MRKRFDRLNCILHYTGHLLEVLGLVLLGPLIVVAVYWGQRDDGWATANAFIISAAVAGSVGFVLRNVFRSQQLDTIGAMLMCTISWLACSAIGALPFVIGYDTSFLNGCFEAASGFTTTAFTIFDRLDEMPRSLLFWRALMEWFGGLGILSFFLIVTFRASSAHHIFGAESHKISSKRPAPGLFNTVKILWLIYGGFTLLGVAVLVIVKMPIFDAVCHALTTVSTGGFSTHDASIGFYRDSGHANYRAIEYALTVMMMLGGINFLIHYRVLTGDFKALWDNIEIRYWWRLIAVFLAIVVIDHLHATGSLKAIFTSGHVVATDHAERTFRVSLFQVISLLSSTGFTTEDIGSPFFGTASKQLFLVMMVIGGCVGSTSGGFKILRVAILNRLVMTELFKAKSSGRTTTGVVIDQRIVPDAEIHRVASLFFGWIALLVVGGLVTAFFTDHSALESFSGMVSALGNMGPSYISHHEMMMIHPAVKVTYIIGMLAGRLEILPVLLLFSPRVWR